MRKPPVCPICGKPTEERTRPFCSPRCADVDLGRWLSEGYGVPGGTRETRLGDQDTARRRGGVTEGLGASRESGRGRQQDREGLGPVRRGRPGQRSGGGRGRGAASGSTSR